MKMELGSAIEVVPPKQKTLQKDIAKRRCNYKWFIRFEKQ
jgi:hypothetical protein